MRTKLRSKVTLLFMTCALLIAVPAVAALADVVQNNIDTTLDASAESRTVSTDGSTVVGYTLKPANNVDGYPDNENGCNAKSGSTVTVTINTPTGVTASQSSLAFTSCDVTQNVTFTATKATAAGSPHVITVNASGGVSGSTTHTNPATWELTVNKAQPTFSAVSGTGNAGASNGSLTATLKNSTKNLSGKDVTFKIDGNDVQGTAQTNGSGVATLTNVNLSGVTQGTKNLTAHFAGDNDYLVASGSGSLVVGASLCTATTAVTTQPQNATATYGDSSVSFTAAANGSPAPSVQWQVNTGSGFTDIAGANSGTLTINNPTVSQNGNQYRAVFTNTCNGTNTVNSNAATLTVNKATADVQLNNLTHTYDGTAKGASATTTPSGLNVNFAYSQNGNSVASPTNAGSYAVVATVADANYQGSASGTLKIDKANATIKVDGYTGTYDGQAHGASGTATGADGSNLSSLLNLGASFTDYPGGTANWSFPGDANHNPASGTASIVIDKADATIKVDGYTGVYDGQAHGATGSAKGVLNEDLSSLLHISGSFTNVPGGTANWSFDGNTNYKAASGTASIVISQATPVLSWSNPAAIDYGTLLSATQLNATAKGVDANTLDGSFVYDPPAGTKLLSGTQTLKATFTPTDATNYKSGTFVTVQIVVNPYQFTGFFQPIDNGGVFNKVKLGSTVPVKFSLGGDKGLDIFAAGYPMVSKPITCGVNPTVDLVEEYAPTGTTSGLKYDAASGQYIYNWKTTDANVKAGECRQLIVKLADGSVAKTANFNFFK